MAKKKYWSAGRPSHVLDHEMGHFTHHKSGGLSTVFRKFTAAEKKMVERQVSRYAATNFDELVAEVFAGSKAGVAYGDEIMALYLEAGGPPL